MTRRWARRLAFAALFTCLLVQTLAAEALQSCSTGTPPPPDVEAALDRVLTEFLDDDGLLGGAPGAVLRIEAPGWTYFKAAGFADPEQGIALSCRAPFEIGSATKMMTGTILMQLYEEGVLGLDDFLSDHLPEIAAQMPNGRRMTLRNLATHTAGLFDYTDNTPDGALGVMEGALHDPRLLGRTWTPAEMLAFAIDHGKPSFAPGAQGQWAYSNTGYLLIGMVIEKVTGKPLAEVFEERIFQPAGLSETFLANGVPPQDLGLPRAWFEWPDGLETSGWNLSQGWASGGVVSTAPDLAAFLRTLMAGRLFSDPKTLSEMQRTLPAPDLFGAYGIGLVYRTAGAWGHGGQTMGFASDSGHIPSTGLTIVVWTNAATSAATQGVPIVMQAVPLGMTR